MINYCPFISGKPFSKDCVGGGGSVPLIMFNFIYKKRKDFCCYFSVGRERSRDKYKQTTADIFRKLEDLC